MNKWPKKRNFMSQFLCFFDTIILCQVHHTTDHLLTRLLFPYVECPYLWIWSMTFLGGKELLGKAKKFSAAVTIVISFRILVLMLTLVIALLNTQGCRYEGVTWGVFHQFKQNRTWKMWVHSSQFRGLCLTQTVNLEWNMKKGKFHQEFISEFLLE